MPTVTGTMSANLGDKGASECHNHMLMAVTINLIMSSTSPCQQQRGQLVMPTITGTTPEDLGNKGASGSQEVTGQLEGLQH